MEDVDIKLDAVTSDQHHSHENYEDYILNNEEEEEIEASSNYNNNNIGSSIVGVSNGDEPSFEIEQVLNANNDFYPRSVAAVYVNQNDDIECLPGYRFNPTDYELIVHYLWRKVRNQTLPHNKIRSVKLYDYNPEDITKTEQGLVDKEWYFFTPRDRKYKNGERPNRAAGNGYWKATGADKKVFHQGVHVGNRKALVFYVGKAPKGDKTNWIMHEFRVESYKRARTSDDDMKLDDWVLCRIYKKDDKYKKAPRQNHAGNSPSEQQSPIEVPVKSNMFDGMGGLSTPCPNPVNIYRGNHLPHQRMIGNGILPYQDAHIFSNSSFNNSLPPGHFLPQPQPQPLMNPSYFQPPLRNDQNNFNNLDHDYWTNAIRENALLEQRFYCPLSFQNDPIYSLSDEHLNIILSPENPQVETLQNVENDQSSS